MIHIKYDGDDTIKLGLNFYSLNNKNSFGVVISWNQKDYKYSYWIRRTKVNKGNN